MNKTNNAVRSVETDGALVARKRLTCFLVHDLRNPLTVVQVNLAHAREHATGEALEAIVDAVAGAQQIESMLTDLLDVALAEDGLLPYSPLVLDVGALVESCARGFRGVIEERHNRLRLSVDADLPRVFADKQLLIRVLQNLLSNAARFAGVGGVVDVCALRAEDSDKVIIRIANDGPSIPDPQKPGLFGKYAQMTQGQTPMNRGLGLYLCRLVAERHEGTIGVRDRPGGGAVFDLVLPTLDSRNVKAP